MLFGTDCPNGAWKNRHDMPAAHIELDSSGNPITHNPADLEKTGEAETSVVPVEAHEADGGDARDASGNLKKMESQTTGTTTPGLEPHHQRKRFTVKVQDIIEEESG